jgi:thioredoxin 1
MNFTEIINSEHPVLVDFFAEWCGPCKMMAPVLKEVKEIVGDQASIIKIDVDKNPQVASSYQIQGVPTFMIFKQGKMLWRKSGAIPKYELVKLLQQYQ